MAMLASCATNEAGTGRSPLLANRNNPAGSTENDPFQRFSASLNSPAPERRVVGTDDFLAEHVIKETHLVEVTNEGAFSLNLIDVPIAQAAKAVLGDSLKKSYTIDPNVNGTVTLQTTRALNERELLDTFQTVLELNKATLQSSGNVIAIVPTSGAARSIATDPKAQMLGVRVVAVPLKYIGTAEMMRLLQPISGESVTLNPITKRNILLISGTKIEINAAIDAINLFDVDVLKGKSVGLFRLKAAEPEAVISELQTIFENQEGGSLQNVITFIPSQRLNAVLVVSSRSKYLSEAERWVRDLDKTAGGAKRRPVVYNLQHRSAVDLAPILESMLENVAEETAGPVSGQPKVAADDTKNAIIVWGNDSEQESFSRLIQTLDTTPVQVLLEATIAEVTLNDELSFGLNWFFQNGSLSKTFSTTETGAIASAFPGLSFVFQGNSSAAALNALSSVTNIEVVSSPSLLVLDNQEARLQIGDEVPIATQQVTDTSSSTSTVVNTISFRDTGIMLSVKPRVSRNGQVILSIEQEVSSVSSTTTSGIDSPTISQRKIETSVVVGDGQTIALGGLIQENRNKTKAKIPGAGDIPVLGALFSDKKDKIAKTELLVLITPRVIRNGQEARDITAELRSRLGGADDFIGSGVGSPNTIHRIIE